jgi:hypothetical protein
MPGTTRHGQCVFAEEEYRASREYLSARLPLPNVLDEPISWHLTILGGYIFEHEYHRFADWTHRIYQDIGPSASSHIVKVWIALPRKIRMMFESSESAGLTAARRADLVLQSRDLADLWQAADIERKQPGGMMHDHYCSGCGSECSEDLEDCVLGTTTLCEQCRSEELYGHEHSCPTCGQNWPCQSSGCVDEAKMACGDCLGRKNDEATQGAERFSGFSLMSGLSSIVVLIGFMRLPYGFYALLRFALCLTAIMGLARAVETKSRSWLWPLAVCAILYNPILPVHLYNKSLWEALNVLTIGLFWLAVRRLRKTDAPRS